MYNPWYNILVKEGTGTLQYQGKWNLFDQIIMTPNLLNKNGEKDYSDLKFWKIRSSDVIICFRRLVNIKGIRNVLRLEEFGWMATLTTFLLLLTSLRNGNRLTIE